MPAVQRGAGVVGIRDLWSCHFNLRFQEMFLNIRQKKLLFGSSGRSFRWTLVQKATPACAEGRAVRASGGYFRNRGAKPSVRRRGDK